MCTCVDAGKQDKQENNRIERCVVDGSRGSCMKPATKCCISVAVQLPACEGNEDSLAVLCTPASLLTSVLPPSSACTKLSVTVVDCRTGSANTARQWW